MSLDVTFEAYLVENRLAPALLTGTTKPTVILLT